MTDSIDARVAQARAELGETLAAIEDKFNVPKRVGRGVELAKASFERNPVPWYVGGGLVLAGVVGLVAWAIFSSDD
jgi:hypothetical protein